MRALGLAVAAASAMMPVFTASAQQATYSVVLPGGGCPVGFSAEVSARAVMHSAEQDQRFGNAPTVELRFLATGEEVVRATVVVHGPAAGGKVLPVGLGHRDGLAAERFELVDETRLGSRQVRLRRLAAVTWAEVTEMRFADGTVWRPGDGHTCRATPPLYKEVRAVAGR